MSWYYCPVCGNHYPFRHNHTQGEVTLQPAREEVGEYHTYTIPDGPKMLKEALCLAQGFVAQLESEQHTSHARILQNLINECDRKRPLYPNGKHGNLHTAECGCEDVPRVKCPQDKRHWLDAHAPGGAWYGIGHYGQPSPWPVKGNDEQQTAQS